MKIIVLKEPGLPRCALEQDIFRNLPPETGLTVEYRNIAQLVEQGIQGDFSAIGTVKYIPVPLKTSCLPFLAKAEDFYTWEEYLLKPR